MILPEDCQKDSLFIQFTVPFQKAGVQFLSAGKGQRKKVRRLQARKGGGTVFYQGTIETIVRRLFYHHGSSSLGIAAFFEQCL